MDYLTKEEIDGLSDKIIDTTEKDIEKKEADNIAKKAWRDSFDSSEIFTTSGSHGNSASLPIEVKKELDLTAVDWVKERCQYEISDDTEFARDMNSSSFKEGLARAYERIKSNSIQDEKRSKIQPCHGEHYAKADKRIKQLENAMKVTLGVAAIVVSIKVGGVITLVDTYNTYLKSTLSEKYTSTQMKELDMPNFFEEYSDLKTSYEELKKSGEYDFLGNKKDGTGSVLPIKSEPNDLYGLNDLTGDAISDATEKRVEEIERSGRLQ